jgi:dephospho-CoA kinase
MGAGKTTIANLLTVSHGYRRLSHADGIKELASWAYGPIEKSQKYSVKHIGINQRSGREVLQLLGQTVKEVDRDFWLKHTLNRVVRSPEPVVNDDTRFIFEAEGLREAGFTIVKVDTPDTIRMQRLSFIYGREPTEEEQQHESEREVDLIPCDLTISGAAEPYAAVQQLVHELGLDKPDMMLSTRRA